MIIAPLLALFGVALGFRFQVFILMPVSFAVSVALCSFWISTGDNLSTKVAIWFGYLAALNAGYIIGSLYRSVANKRNYYFFNNMDGQAGNQ